jgi:hypothetical protein
LGELEYIVEGMLNAAKHLLPGLLPGTLNFKKVFSTNIVPRRQ